MAGEPRAACLSDATIALLLEGNLPADGRSAVMEHVDGCESCRQLVSDCADDGIPSTRRQPIFPGEVIAEKYEVVRVVGEGGMGRVLEARHLELGQNVAMKVMHEEALADSDSVARFLREGRIAAKLRSDHAVRIHDVGRLPSGVPYLVMELLVGEDLNSLQKKRELTVEEAVGYVLEAADALGEAHEQGLIHRDLKPHNLFLAELHGGKSRVKVVDFGLAKDLRGATPGSTLTADEVVLGSPSFMSPEQVCSPKDVDARADVWALGATLFQLLAGRPPFHAYSAHGMLAAILQDAVPSVREFRAEVSEDLARALAGALEKDVEKRYPDMRTFATALRTAMGIQEDNRNAIGGELVPTTKRMAPPPGGPPFATGPGTTQPLPRPPRASAGPGPAASTSTPMVPRPTPRSSRISPIALAVLAAIVLTAVVAIATKIALR